jgi:hypothetical protein
MAEFCEDSDEPTDLGQFIYRLNILLSIKEDRVVRWKATDFSEYGNM